MSLNSEKKKVFPNWHLWLGSGRGQAANSVVQSCLTLCNPVDCSLPDYSFLKILQARILKQIALSFSRGSSPLRD